jgi:hypothetical protein
MSREIRMKTVELNIEKKSRGKGQMKKRRLYTYPSCPELS